MKTLRRAVEDGARPGLALGCVIGFGHLPDHYEVAASPRRSREAFHADGATTDPRPAGEAAPPQER